MRNKARCRNYRSAWPIEEMRYVEAHDGPDSVTAIAAHLRRSRGSVSCMEGKLVLSFHTARQGAEEEAVLPGA